MKQTILTIILTFVFSFTIFAQSEGDKVSSGQSSPKLVAEFDDANNEWYKLAIESVGLELGNDPTAIGIISVKNDGERKLAFRLQRLKQSIAFRRIDPSRIIFLLVDKQEHDTNVLATTNYSELLQCEDCIMIRAIDMDKVSIKSKPKTIIKSRKKK